MLNVNDYNDYYNQKIEMLSELLSCSENIMSSVNNDLWEEYESLGQKRQSIVLKIDAFEKSYRELYNHQLTAEQKEMIDSKVQLILGFDKDIVALLKEEKSKVLAEIRKGGQEKNILHGYKKNEIPISGTFFDIKK